MSDSQKPMTIHLKVWRQPSRSQDGKLVEYKLDHVFEDMSFLEMMDTLNTQLIHKGEPVVAFDHDCREGICGSCSMVVNGSPHGPQKATAVCQLHMRTFKDGDHITVEPWRARAFPIIKDLVVDRSAFDRIIQAGGYVSVNTGSAKEANALPVPKQNSDLAFDAATCISCGACVAACKNGSAMLFVGAKVSQLALLPQGQPERQSRVLDMVAQMDAEGFGACTNTASCSFACPKSIGQENIARLNREYVKATLTSRPPKDEVGGEG